MGSSSFALSWKLSKWGLVGAALAPGYPVRALDGARFTEEVRTEAITRLESSEHRRSLAREVNITPMRPGEFAAKLHSGDGFALSVMNREKIWLIGCDHDLAELVEDRAAERTRAPARRDTAPARRSRAKPR